MKKFVLTQEFIRKHLSNNKVALVTSFLILILLSVILLFSSGYTGGTDTLLHYKISRYAFSYPEFFLDQWAKPVFTIFTAPFALLGLKGIQFFNILAGVIAGYFSFLVSRELNYKHPVLTTILCCFTPVFMLNLFSGLTEILFATISIISVYLLLRKRFVLAAVIISLLPLVRPEGYYLIIVFGLYLLYLKQHRSLPWLLSGFVVYSIIGLLYFKNFSWLFNESTSIGVTDLRESGSFFQFLKRSPGYFGIPNEIMMATGLVASITVALRGLKENREEFMLIVLPFLVYFVIHSFEWWTGIGNSQGLNRYMAAIVPFVAILALRGMNLIALVFVIISKKIWFLTICGAVGIFFVIYVPFVVNSYPVKYDKYGQVMIEASDFIKSNGYHQNKIISYDPFFFYSLDINPFDSTRYYLEKGKTIYPEQGIKAGDILIFDNRFGAYAGVNYDSLITNKNFKLLFTAEPKVSFSINDIYPYKVAVLQKN